MAMTLTDIKFRVNINNQINCVLNNKSSKNMCYALSRNNNM